MPVVDVKNLEGKKVGQIDLADDVFAAKVNPHLLHEAVRHHLAGERAGTHKTKDKSEVSGSGKKLWKQKGTGRARVGSIRSPLWRHGGTVHGPVPRSYDYALPKKMILGALRSALSAKVADQKLTVVDGWNLESHKTKAFREMLGQIAGADRNVPAGGKRRECEPGTRQPQSRRRDVGATDGSGTLRLVAARACDAVARSGGEAEPFALVHAAGSPGADRASCCSGEEGSEREGRGSESSGEGYCGENGKVGEEARGEKRS